VAGRSSGSILGSIKAALEIRSGDFIHFIPTLLRFQHSNGDVYEGGFEKGAAHGRGGIQREDKVGPTGPTGVESNMSLA